MAAKPLLLWFIFSIVLGIGICDLNEDILKSLIIDDSLKDKQTITLHFGYKTYIGIFLLLSLIQICIFYRTGMRLNIRRNCLKRAN